MSVENWLNGKVLCREAKRHICNFIAVYRVRPQDEDAEDCNSDDIISDEELELSSHNLAEALTTKIGGRDPDGMVSGEDALESGTHHANSEAAMQLGAEVWAGGSGSSDPHTSCSMPSFTAPAAVTAALKDATASQKGEKTLASLMAEAPRASSVIEEILPGADAVETWLMQLKLRKTRKVNPWQTQNNSRQ